MRKISERVEKYLNIRLFRSFIALREMKLDESSFTSKKTSKLRIAYDFCLFYIDAGFTERSLPLLDFWYTEREGKSE